MPVLRGLDRLLAHAGENGSWHDAGDGPLFAHDSMQVLGALWHSDVHTVPDAIPQTSSSFGLSDEVAFISGVYSNGTLPLYAFWAWNNDNPATYTGGYTNSQKWGANTAPTPGGTVYYYFDPASNWNATEKTALASGLAMWSAVANISFAQTTNAANAEIDFVRGTDGGAHTDPTLSGGSNAGVTGGSILETLTNATVSIDTSVHGFGPIDGNFTTGGGYPTMTYLHEEGHSIGLGHAGPYNGDVDAMTQQFSPYDTRLWSIMSYINPTDPAKYSSQYPVTGTGWGHFYPTGLMPLDILAAQSLYGTPTSTPLSGGQTFGFNCNVSGAIEPYYDFTKNTHPILAIWDAGTGNTLDLSGFSVGSTVNLNPGTFSNCDNMQNNLAIAANTHIDGLVGTSARDSVTCNNDGDTVNTGAGNDEVFGGSGADHIVAGSGDDVIHDSSGGNVFDFSGGGSDTLDAGSGSGGDTILMGATFDATDSIADGGSGDTMQLDGDYGTLLTITGQMLQSAGITLSLHAGHAYNLALAGGGNAFQGAMTVDGSSLGAGDVLTFKGQSATAGLDLIGGAGNDALTGGNYADIFDLSHGGNDVAKGNDGDDTFLLGGAFTAKDTIDGGSGDDIAIFNGNYSAGLHVNAGTMRGVETLTFTAGHSYDLHISDSVLAAGTTMTVAGSALGAPDSLGFHGGKETDGSFAMTGGAGDDALVGGDMNDSFDLTLGGKDVAFGHGGSDTFDVGGAFTSADDINGGAGNDVVILDGNYAFLGINAGTMRGVETLTLDGGHSYAFRTSDAVVAAGATLTVDASALGTSDALFFNGTRETNGHFNFVSGLGADELTGGALSDTFTYGGAADSSSSTYDTIHHFDFNSDLFDLPAAVTGIDAEVHGGQLDAASFDGDLASAMSGLGIHHAELFAPDSGSLSGHLFLVVDANGTAGYQSGQDFVFDVTGAQNIPGLGIHDFI